MRSDTDSDTPLKIKKERTLPWEREDAQKVIEVFSNDEEPTEEDELIENSEDEDKPIRVITVNASNMKYVHRITAKQWLKTQQLQPLASATNIKSMMSSSMESDYFSCPSTTLKRKKPVSKM